MRGLLRILSTVLAGSMLAAVNFAPAVEVRRFVNNRRRVVYAILLTVTALALMSVTALVGLIDLVIQFEKQGAPAWNGLLTALSLTFAASVLMLLTARAILPRVKDFVIRTTAEDLIAGLQTIAEPLIKHWHLAAQQATGAAEAGAAETYKTPRTEIEAEMPAEIKDKIESSTTVSKTNPSNSIRTPELAPL